MGAVFNFLLEFLSQFAGGTGQMENNLVRFAIPAVTYGVFLNAAWTRRREQNPPRERLLVWGFGFGCASAILMWFFVALQMLGVIERQAAYAYLVPVERALAMSSIIVIAGAFLRYILNNARLAQVYIRAGLAVTIVCLLLALWLWPSYLAMFTEARFHDSWVSWLFQVPTPMFIIAAVALLRRKRGWLTNVVTVALGFFLIGELLFLVNYALDREYNRMLCPIGNTFPILAIPLLGYVYLREQALESKRAHSDLEAYRAHLEELVIQRTSEISTAYAQLKEEAYEREQAQAEIARRNAELALLHQISIELTSTFDTAKIYAQVAAHSVKLLSCQAAGIFAWDEKEQQARLVASAGISAEEELQLPGKPGAPACLHDLVHCSESVVIDDAGADPRVPPAWSEQLGVRALLCVPIRSLDESFGVLFLIERRAPRRWRLEETVLLESFVNSAAVALMNASLIRRLERAAALEERQRIAADMHDGLAQTVSLLGLQIEGAMELVASGAGQQAVEDLSTARDTVDQVSLAVRRSIATLQKTSPPRRSLQEMLTGLPGQIAWEDGRPVELDFKVQEPVFLPQEQAEQALLVAQEALLNAQRHARAQHIALTLERSGRELRICVADDGQGFARGDWWEGRQDHFGLGIMHSRAARIGADLLIDSAPGQGTRVTLVLTGMGSPAGSQPGAVSPSPEPRG